MQPNDYEAAQEQCTSEADSKISNSITKQLKQSLSQLSYQQKLAKKLSMYNSVNRSRGPHSVVKSTTTRNDDFAERSRMEMESPERRGREIHTSQLVRKSNALEGLFNQEDRSRQYDNEKKPRHQSVLHLKVVQPELIMSPSMKEPSITKVHTTDSTRQMTMPVKPTKSMLLLNNKCVTAKGTPFIEKLK